MQETNNNLEQGSASAPAGQDGFTLIEMLVVIAIISIITGIFLINFNQLEGARNLRIAQNQLTTDLRKIQSYTLSSRNVTNSGKPASYYIAKFDATSPNSYTLGAIDNQNNYYDIQTVTLPKNIVISGLSVKEANGDITLASCAHAAFGLPFGRVFMDYKSKLSGEQSFAQQEQQVLGTGQLSVGSGCDIVYVLQNSGDMTPNKNLILTITLTDTSGAQKNSNFVELNGISQVIDAH